MSGEAAPQGDGSAMTRLKTALGLGGGGLGGPKPVSTLKRQDSFPEICNTPSEVGIFEVAHNKPSGVSWMKYFFEAPGGSTPRGANSTGVASPSTASNAPAPMGAGAAATAAAAGGGSSSSHAAAPSSSSGQ